MVAKRKKKFSRHGMYKPKEQRTLHYLTERTTFWVAVLSIFTFTAGNILGQHGLTVFLASVMGRSADSTIVFTGAVYPVPQIPDIAAWGKLGGNVHTDSFRQVPKDLLRPFPAYSQSQLNGTLKNIVMVDWMGTYSTGEGQGSHVASDISAPIDSPVVSMANGVVVKAGFDAGGDGNYIVIEHPNAPDPDDSSKLTTLYSSYCHLNALLVQEGDAVQKGEQIGTVGMTGFATGPHLHFQLDRVMAPWHPYWPFTGAEQRAAGLTMTQAVDQGFHRERGLQYTVNPLLYVAQHAQGTAVAAAGSKSASSVSSATIASMSPAARRAARMAKLQLTDTPIVAMQAPEDVPAAVVQTVSSSSSAAAASSSSSAAVASSAPGMQEVASVEIRHDGAYADRQRETLTVTLLDSAGALVEHPRFDRTIEIRTAYGRADFFPSALTQASFVNGKATVQMLGYGPGAVVVIAQPYGSMSKPMKYER